MSDKKGANRAKRKKDVSEVEMVQTGDSGIFQNADFEEDSDGFAKPKGVQTRVAIAKHLARKLNIANNTQADLQMLMNYEKELRSNEENNDTFWQEKMSQVRKRLEEERRTQEAELQAVINEARMEEFSEQEPTLVMMTHDLRDKLKKERQNQNTEGYNQTSLMISCNNPWRKRWSYTIIVVAIYSVAFIPLRMAVYPTVLDPIYNPLDIFTYILYILDVIINLRTTYLDSFGEEIKDSKKIMTHYVYSVGFWIDVLSLLNYPLGSNPVLNMIGILKVNRVLRISTLITQSNMEKGPKIMMQMLYYYMLFIIYLHVVACLWFFFIEKTYKTYLENDRYQPWIPPYDYYDGNDNYWEKYEEGGNEMFLYFVCLYYSVLVIGGNEMGPKELSEICFMVIINLTGAIFQAYIFGELAVLIAQVGRKSQEQQEIIDTANTAMENVKLPQPLRKDIREYFKTIMLTMQNQDELSKFFDKISPSLSERVRGHMFENVLKDHNAIIKETQKMMLASKNVNKNQEKTHTIQLSKSVGEVVALDGQKRANLLLDTIVVTLGTSLNLPDEEVIKQDDYKDEELAMFFVGTGHCRVKVRDQIGREQNMGQLNEGDHFGEVALMYQCKRSATVISSNYNTFARVLKPRFREIISEFPEYEQCLKANAIRSYRDKKIQFVLRMIKRVEYLKKHDDEVLFDLMFSLTPKTFEKDTIVLPEDHPASELYFVEDGILQAYTRFEGNEFIIEQLHKGSAINHRAFFMQDSMYVNFRCLTDAKLLCLSHTKMKELIEKYAGKPFGRDLLIYQNKILKQERKFPCDYVMRLPKTINTISDDQAYRENCLKNVVMRIIIEIRERKKRPKLSDFIAVYREKKNEAGASKGAVKEEFQNKFRILYGGEIEEKAEDKKFDEMMASFNRLQSQLQTQQNQLSNVIKQVNALIDHRDKREKQIELGKGKEKNFKRVSTTKKPKSSGLLANKTEDSGLKRDPQHPIEEEKGVDEDSDAGQSARQRRNESDLAAVNEHYLAKKEDSELAKISKQAKGKPGTAETIFQPFNRVPPEAPVEEIINTSKEVKSDESKQMSVRESDVLSDPPSNL